MALNRNKRKKKSRRAKRRGNPNSPLWRRKADRAWSEAVYAEWDGRCAVCGESAHLNAHHLIPRGRRATRHDTKNGILLCVSHHLYDRTCSAHGGPLGFANWLQTNHPEVWTWVQIHLHATFDRSRCESYREAWERLTSQTPVGGARSGSSGDGKCNAEPDGTASEEDAT